MTVKVEYDFLDFASFPSSLKVSDDRGTGYWAPKALGPWGFLPSTDRIYVKPPAKFRIEGKIKTENVGSGDLAAWFHLEVHDAEGKYLAAWGSTRVFGTTPWTDSILEVTVDREGYYVASPRVGGSGTKGEFAISKFDDFKVYLNGKLIYANDFSNWNPYIGAGAGGVGGALAGYLVTRNPLYALIGIPGALAGAAVGYYTAKP